VKAEEIVTANCTAYSSWKMSARRLKFMRVFDIGSNYLLCTCDYSSLEEELGTIERTWRVSMLGMQLRKRASLPVAMQ
jgi:hypothetical protein